MSKLNPLIIALDTSSSLKALHFVQTLKVTGVAFKIGLELFSSAGPRIVKKILNHHVRVFLDLKFHDIPHTVARAAAQATRLGVWMFNVHASGGSAMMKAAKQASLEAAEKYKTALPLVLGVTVLTSLDSLEEINVKENVLTQAVHLASLAKGAGLDGVVCSAHEASPIREKCGKDFCLVTPGIRLPTDSLDDQKRSATPEEAIRNGSHYLVVGRPVLQSSKPIQVIDHILSSL